VRRRECMPNGGAREKPSRSPDGHAAAVIATATEHRFARFLARAFEITVEHLPLQMLHRGEPLLLLGEVSTTGGAVRLQHEQDIVDPSSIIELFQQHPPDIPPVDTMELIRLREAVTLLVWPGMHTVAVTQNHPRVDR
jgi:hypothetical protein